ncbi:hypothetical protein FLW53_40225 [Microbispora sp. SCL1-1]|nr:hypothetical protein FLW53_40225 [Microbispora sp. SCL1-1]
MEFATKPVLARTLLARAVKVGVPASWVSADEAYGMDNKVTSTEVVYEPATA